MILQVSPSLFVQPNDIAPHLPLTKSFYHKLKMPHCSEPVAAPTLNLLTKGEDPTTSTGNTDTVAETTKST